MSSSSPPQRGKIRRAIAGVAPSLARALGGPLAGAAVQHISNAVFGEPGLDETRLSQAIAGASPEQWLALQRAERDFARALREADVEERRIAAGDRADARARQAAMADWTPTALGGLIIIGFFAVLGAMVGRNLPSGAETEFSIMLGALATMTAAVVNYFFGSSAGSKEKTRLIGAPPASPASSALETPSGEAARRLSSDNSAG